MIFKSVAKNIYCNRLPRKINVFASLSWASDENLVAFANFYSNVGRTRKIAIRRVPQGGDGESVDRDKRRRDKIALGGEGAGGGASCSTADNLLYAVRFILATFFLIFCHFSLKFWAFIGIIF